MEIRHLRYLDAVAAERHFGRAAARLGITQPTLTRQVQRLERDVGVRLLHRGRRGVLPTAAGARFLEEARAILSACDRTVAAARLASREARGPLTLGTLTAPLLAVLTRVLPRLRQRHPGITVRLRTTLPNEEQVAALRSGILDAGFLFLPFRAPDLAVRPILDDPLVAALPPGDPLAGARRVRLEDLDDRPLVFFPRARAPVFHDFVIDLFRARGLRMRIVAEADSHSSVLGLIAAGIGAAIFPASLAAIRAPGVRFVPLDSSVPSTGIALVHRRDPPSPALAAFLAEVRRAFPARGARRRRRPAVRS